MCETLLNVNNHKDYNNNAEMTTAATMLAMTMATTYRIYGDVSSRRFTDFNDALIDIAW